MIQEFSIFLREISPLFLQAVEKERLLVNVKDDYNGYARAVLKATLKLLSAESQENAIKGQLSTAEITLICRVTFRILSFSQKNDFTEEGIKKIVTYQDDPVILAHAAKYSYNTWIEQYDFITIEWRKKISQIAREIEKQSPEYLHNLSDPYIQPTKDLIEQLQRVISNLLEIAL